MILIILKGIEPMLIASMIHSIMEAGMTPNKRKTIRVINNCNEQGNDSPSDYLTSQKKSYEITTSRDDRTDLIAKAQHSAKGHIPCQRL